MKKFNILLCITLLGYLSFAQALLTIKDTNGETSPAYGTADNTTSAGLSRGAGTLYYSDGTGYTLGGLDAVTETEAILNNDYLEFSIQADANYNLTIAEVDIRLATQEDDGPLFLNIYYSFDEFATPGTPLSETASALSTTGAQNLSFTLLDIVSAKAQNTTFRVYAWGGVLDSELAYFSLSPEANWDGLGITGPSIRIVGTANTVYTFDNVWIPSDPNGAATAAESLYINSGNAVISANTTVNSVIIAPSAALTVQTGSTLTADTVKLESTSTSYSSLISGTGGVEGVIEYDRYVNGTSSTGGNDLISAPLTGQTFEDFQLANENIVSNVDETLFLFGPLEKTVGSFVTYSDSETETLDPGVGYRAAATGENGGLFTFTGEVTSGIVTANISNSGTYYKAWNLIGNPYPSYISVQDFLNFEVSPGVKNIDLMTSTNAGIYGYDGNASNGYTVYNKVNIDENTLMAPGQGFYITADPDKVDTHDITFSPSMRRTGSSDDFILGRSTNGTDYLQLTVANANNNFNTEFYFNENASLGLDPGYDAALFGDTAPAFSIYSQLVEDNEGRNMAIQCFGNADMNDVIVPLGINAPQAQQTTISINQTTLPANIAVYLEDNLTNTQTNLTTGDYVFTPNTALSGMGRFFLRFSNSTLSTNSEISNAVQVFAIPDNIVVNGRFDQTTAFELYDVQGRLVFHTQLNPNITKHVIDASTLSPGIYISNLRNPKLQQAQKLIIK